MSGFMDVSKYTNKTENKSTNKTPSFMDVSKYKFMDTSKYTKKEEKPKEMSFLDKAKAFLTSSSQVLPKSMPDAPASAFSRGVADSTSLGLTENKESQDYQKKHPLAYKAGELTGYITPSGLLNHGIEKVIGKTSKNAVERIVTGAINNGTIAAAEGGVRNVKHALKGEEVQNAGDYFKDVGTAVAAGGLFEGGLLGLGKLGNKLGKSAFKSDVHYEKMGGLKSPNLTGKINTNNIAKEFNPQSLKELPTPKAEIQNASNVKGNIKSNLNKLYTKVVDSNNPTKLIGKDTHMMATNANNTQNIIGNIVHNGLTDSKTGKKIGQSLEELSKSIPKGQENEFEQYMRHKHNIDRASEVKDADGKIIKEAKPIYTDYTPEMSSKAVKLYEKEHPEWKKISNNITSWIDKFHREWGVKTGITDSDMYEILRANNPNYIPTNREFSSLEEGFRKSSGGRGFVDQSGVIKKATGSDRNLTPIMENLVNMVNRTVKTAKYNEVGQTLLKEIRKKPSSYAEIIPEGTEINPNVKNVVTVLEKGKPINIQINDEELLKNLQGMGKNNDGDITKIARAVTNKYTGLITHKNPVFALRNMARDIPTAYINGSTKNPLKFGKDLIGAGKDIVTKSDAYQQYKGLGGGGSNFMAGDAKKVAQNLIKKPNIGQKVLTGIENFNNITESAPRLAEFKRVLDKTGDVQQAIYAANDVTVNFARGGNVTKNVNAFVPFSNASVQGLDKLARSLDPRNPAKMVSTLIKGGVAITAPTMFFDYINKDNPNYKALDNRTKDNYYLIPDGDKFIKIPKSRELGVLFGSLFERLHRQASGEKGAFKDFGNTAATNFSPTNPLENNIFSPVLNLKTNKDFANRDIVPRVMKDQNLSPKYQYDEKTSEIAKKIGQIPIPSINGGTTNLSPKQVDYIIRSYTGVLGQLGLPIFTNSTYNGNKLSNLAKPITSQFVADPLYNNQASTDFYNNLDMLKQKAADKNFVDKIPSKEVTKEELMRGLFTKVQSVVSDLNKEIKNTDDPDKVKKLRKAILNLQSKSNNLIK